MKRILLLIYLFLVTPGSVVAEEEHQEELFLREESILSSSGDFSSEMGVFFSRANRITTIGPTSYVARRETSTASLTLRYGLTQRSELSLTLPYRYVQDNLIDSNGTEFSADGPGDVVASFKYQLWFDSKNTPDLILSVTLDSDSGDVSETEEPSLGSGHWEYTGSALLATTIDPAIYFMQLGYRIADSEMYTGQKREPGDAILYRFGSGFALSSRIIISFQLVGEAVQEGRYGDQKILETHKASFQFANTILFSRHRFIEPLISFGLTPEAPDVLFGVSFPL